MVELHYAAFSGDIQLVKDLLHKNYDPFDEISDLQFEFEDENGITDFVEFNIPLSSISVAARFGKKDVLEILLESIFGKSSSHLEECNCTLCKPGPLHLSLLGGWVECAALLISHGWDVNERDSVLWTPLQVAAYKGDPKVVKYLLDNYPINVDDSYEEAIFIAAEHGNCRICEELLAGCGHKLCTLIQPALEIACEHQNTETIEILLEQRIHKDVNICKSGFQRCYELIIEDPHQIGRASEVFQVFANTGAPVPKLEKIPTITACPPLYIPKLSLMCFDKLNQNSSIPKTKKKYLEKELCIKQYYKCNGCQQQYSNNPCFSVPLTFIKSENNSEALFHFCYHCNNTFV